MLLVSEHDRGEPSEEPHTSLSVEKKHSRDDLFGGAGNASVQGTVSWNDVERGPQSMPSVRRVWTSASSGRCRSVGATATSTAATTRATIGVQALGVTCGTSR